MDTLVLAALGLPVGLALGLLSSFLASRREPLPPERPAEKPPTRRVALAPAAALAKPERSLEAKKAKPLDASAFVPLFVDFLSFVLLRRAPGVALHRRPYGAPPRRTLNGFRALGPRPGDRPERVRGAERVPQGALCWQCGRPLDVGDHAHGG